MLDFRILFGAVLVAVAFMAGVLFSFDETDVAIATLPRPHVETAAVLRSEPVVQPPKDIVIPKPIFPPHAAALEITGSIDPAPASTREIAAPPRPRPRVAAKKSEAEEAFLSLLRVLFPFHDFDQTRNYPVPSHQGRSESDISSLR